MIYISDSATCVSVTKKYMWAHQCAIYMSGQFTQVASVYINVFILLTKFERSSPTVSEI